MSAEDYYQDRIELEWVPDKLAKGCLLCHEKFNLRKRRHHCRQCGTLVCGKCSSRRKKVEGHSREVRVCDDCFDEKDPSEDPGANLFTPAELRAQLNRVSNKLPQNGLWSDTAFDSLVIGIITDYLVPSPRIGQQVEFVRHRGGKRWLRGQCIFVDDCEALVQYGRKVLRRPRHVDYLLPVGWLTFSHDAYNFEEDRGVDGGSDEDSESSDDNDGGFFERTTAQRTSQRSASNGMIVRRRSATAIKEKWAKRRAQSQHEVALAARSKDDFF